MTVLKMVILSKNMGISCIISNESSIVVLLVYCCCRLAAMLVPFPLILCVM